MGYKELILGYGKVRKRNVIFSFILHFGPVANIYNKVLYYCIIIVRRHNLDCSFSLHRHVEGEYL